MAHSMNTLSVITPFPKAVVVRNDSFPDTNSNEYDRMKYLIENNQ